MNRVNRTRARAALFITVALLAASCGGDGDAVTTTTPDSIGTAASTTVQAVETTAPPVTISPLMDGTVTGVPLADDFDPEAIFRWGYSIGPTSLDPHRGTNSADQNYLYPVYDRLVYASPSGEYEPMLATSWTISSDGTKVDFKIREGVTFHDGKNLDADVVKLSLDRARGEASTVKAELANVLDVTVTGPMSVRVILSGGAAPILGSLSDRAGMIISPGALNSPELGVKPVGSGPYEVSEYLLGDRVVYTKFAEYWEPEIQRTAGLEFRIMSDATARINALKSGELDMTVVGAAAVPQLTVAGVGVLAAPSPQFVGLTLNASRPPFDNPKVREALFRAMDRSGISQAVTGGLCAAQIQYWPATSWAYDQDMGNGLDVWKFDTAAAKALLAEAGFANGFEFTLVVAPVPTYLSMAEILQQSFAEIGVTMNIEQVDAAEVYNLYKVKKSYDASIEVFVASPDPSGAMQRVLLPTAIGNPGGLSSDAIVELSDQADSEADSAARADMFHQIMAEVIKLVPHVGVICMNARTEAFSGKVSGIAAVPSGARDFRGVAVSKD